MKGFLIKDLRMLMKQKNTFFMVSVIGLVLSLTGSNPVFIISYMIYVTATYLLGTIAMDAQNNGMAFLMTLPANRRDYVVEKYGLILGGAMCVGTIFTLIAFGVASIKGQEVTLLEYAGTLLASLISVVIAFSVIIPINIKYGAEKSRVVFLILFGTICLGLYLVHLVAGDSVEGMEIFLENINRISCLVMIAVAAVSVAFAVFVSVEISIMIMKKKEY